MAEKAIQDSSSCYKEAIQKHLDAYRLGAISHDAPYYHRYGKSEFRFIAKYLHGGFGHDTFEPLLKLLEGAEKDSDDRATSFILGMFSHAVVDQVFHPMIYYFTGDYYDADKTKRKLARSRHRLFEVYLDSYIRKSKQFSISPDLFDETEKASTVLAELSFPKGLEYKKNSEKEWKESLNLLLELQGAFHSTVVGALVRGINLLSFKKFLELDCLFSFGRNEPLEMLGLKNQFKNPATGIESNSSVDELIELAISRLSKLFHDLENGSRAELKGSSLNFDTFDTTAVDAKYFSEDFIPKI